MAVTLGFSLKRRNHKSGHCSADDNGEWARAAKTLPEGTEAVLAKIEANDAAGAQVAFKGVTASCAACHKAHEE